MNEEAITTAVAAAEVAPHYAAPGRQDACTTTPAPVEALTVDAVEGAALLHIGRTNFLKLNSSGRLPMPIRFGRSVRWRKQELQDWLNADCPSREKWNWKKA